MAESTDIAGSWHFTMTQFLHGELPSFLSDIRNSASAPILLHLRYAKFSVHRAPRGVPSLSIKYLTNNDYSCNLFIHVKSRKPKQ